ncbi:hypothetical protein [Lachnotalea glycerini]|uniref:Uncharacterized protein n=1 Tax=Lachnotalea glycerini TaxID=1763509 RepID=A0A371JBX4_9FIRM|nr:hypothetical protein [Lachnotalea glycerini]RDY30166.1 hypothetical protein CG710_016130 [Lachnotalea glycerini]
MRRLNNNLKTARINLCAKLHKNGFTLLAYLIDKETCNYLDYMKRISRIIKKDKEYLAELELLKNEKMNQGGKNNVQAIRK